ncbi:MAG: hypothetical protein OEO77_14280 [Acidimicrobiia bacterium]|nr:hypothetical protein [Acidimicrobiia bacterium]
MVRKVVFLAVVVLIGFGAFIVFAPMAPDGSFLRDWREAFAEVMGAWWGNPIAP